MTAITYDGATPTVGADADTWGGELNVGALAKIKVDLDMLNTTPTATLLGRVTAATGEVERLTGTQAATIVDPFVGDSGAGGLKGAVPAPAAGDAAAGKVLTAAGTWGGEIKARGCFTGSTGAAVAARNLTLNRTGAGQYDATISPAMASVNYEVHINCSTGGNSIFGVLLSALKSTTQFRFRTVDVTDAAIDPVEIYVTVIG